LGLILRQIFGLFLVQFWADLEADFAYGPLLQGATRGVGSHVELEKNKVEKVTELPPLFEPSLVTSFQNQSFFGTFCISLFPSFTP
jgi:hypothetical protein